jgi:hypothetical protein
MSKVSIGLRGWRFDEDEVFDEEGNYRPYEEMAEDVRERVIRLPALMEMPCDGCYLTHGEDGDEDDYQPPASVYGEPEAEVLLCDDHEPDFYYWFLEDGGEQYKGEAELQDAFHEWFAAGNRAPDWYDGPEHVQENPADLPSPDVPDPEDVTVELPEEKRDKVDLRAVEDSLEGVSIDKEYPTGDE